MIMQRATFTIGSDTGCDLVLADETVAPRHAQIEISSTGTLILTDCGQAPATKLVHQGEARPVRRAVLTAGDHVRFGDLELSVPELIDALELDRRVPDWRPDAIAREADPDEDADAAAADATAREKAAGEAAAREAKRDEAAGEEAEARRASKNILLPCARCGTMTDSLKRNRIARYFVFAWLFWWGQFADYTACPSCMRLILVQRALINLPGANIAWPIIVLVNGWHFVWTFQRGHNKRVKALLP
jgi:hypothetical protein